MTENEEKQIEEMALIICEDCAKYTRGCEHPPCDTIVESAEALYYAGYRKQSEVAAEIFADIDGKISCFFPASSFVKAPNTTHYSLLAMLAELKKKYTGETEPQGGEKV